MKLIQISDLHIIAPGEKIYELDPLQRLYCGYQCQPVGCRVLCYHR
jgi:hypothetical protein